MARLRVLSGREVCRILQQHGFTEVRHRGSHVVMQRRTETGTTTPPDDDHPEVLWWYRNLVGAQHFSIQGYRRNRIYPDFVVQQGDKTKPVASVVVAESKGKHLKGSEDTAYKRKVAEYFGRIGQKVPWQKLAKDFQDERFRFQILDEDDYADKDWRQDLRKLLQGNVC